MITFCLLYSYNDLKLPVQRNSPACAHKSIFMSVCALCCVTEVDRVQSGVLESSIIKYEGDTVALACHTTASQPVDWEIRNSTNHGKFRRVYSAGYLASVFQKSGRYAIHSGNGYYNLSISGLTIDDTDNFVCNENAGDGPLSTVRLTVKREYHIRTRLH